MVRRAIGTHDARSVNSEHHVELRQRHVNDHLIDSTLHERGVQRNNRLFAVRCHAARKAYGMLFANARIDKTLREFLGELVKPSTALHGGRDGDDFVVGLRLLHERLAEHACVQKACST